MVYLDAKMASRIKILEYNYKIIDNETYLLFDDDPNFGGWCNGTNQGYGYSV